MFPGGRREQTEERDQEYATADQVDESKRTERPMAGAVAVLKTGIPNFDQQVIAPMDLMPKWRVSDALSVDEDLGTGRIGADRDSLHAWSK